MGFDFRLQDYFEDVEHESQKKNQAISSLQERLAKMKHELDTTKLKVRYWWYGVGGVSAVRGQYPGGTGAMLGWYRTPRSSSRGNGGSGGGGGGGGGGVRVVRGSVQVVREICWVGTVAVPWGTRRCWGGTGAVSGWYRIPRKFKVVRPFQ